jgi:hypothetical protein
MMVELGGRIAARGISATVMDLEKNMTGKEWCLLGGYAVWLL